MAKFTDIYDIYAQQVFRYLLSLSGDSQVAEELTQETFYKAFLHINQFEGKSSIYTWLCQIGRNTYYNQCKAKKLVSYDPELMENVSDDSMDIIESMVTKNRALMIHKVLHKLKEPYKEVFTLRVFGELKFKEIAEIFGKTETWTKVTYYRAKERVVHEMEGLE